MTNNAVTEEFMNELVLSLPPLESRDWNILHQDLCKISSANANAENLQSVRDKLVCKNHNDNDSNSVSSPSAKALKTAVGDAQKSYNDITARFSIGEDSSNDNNVIIELQTYVEHLDPHNWGTGYWAGQWSIKSSSNDNDDKSGYTVSGRLSTHVYCFEDGANVQKQASVEYNDDNNNAKVFAANDDLDELAKEIVAYTASLEKQFLADLSDQDAVMTSLKHIRRILPITRTRMKWDVAAQKQVTLLNARKAS